MYGYRFYIHISVYNGGTLLINEKKYPGVPVDGTLVFSYIDMKSQEIKVNG